ncbi:MAG: hypothetical protein AB1831_14855 [Pseudomonadota bacterium]
MANHPQAAIEMGNAGLFNRILMVFVPDKAATTTGVVLIGACFALGFIEMLSRNFDKASLNFYLAIGMMTFLVVMKYMSLRANIVVAQSSHSMLIRHIHRHQHDFRGPETGRTASRAEAEAEERARERAGIMEALGNLKDALRHIEESDPNRVKYEATIEMMERILANG